MIPGALGRCDFTHTFWYGLPALVLTCVGLWKQSKSLPAVFVSVTAVCFLCLKIAHFVLCYAGMCMPDAFFALLNHYTTPAAASQQDQAGRGGGGYAADKRPDPANLAQFGRMAAPLGCRGDTYWYLLSNDLYQYEYFDGCMCVASPEQVARKLADLKRAEIILVERGTIEDKQAFLKTWESNRTVLSVLFLFPCGFLRGETCRVQSWTRDPRLHSRQLRSAAHLSELLLDES